MVLWGRFGDMEHPVYKVSLYFTNLFIIIPETFDTKIALNNVTFCIINKDQIQNTTIYSNTILSLNRRDSHEVKLRYILTSWKLQQKEINEHV